MARQQQRRRQQRRTAKTRGARMVFGKTNYLLLAGAVSLVVLGFALMRIENEVDGFISLYLSPLMVAVGYVGVLVAILHRPAEPVEA